MNEPYCWLTTPLTPGKKQLVRAPCSWPFVWRVIEIAADRQMTHFPERGKNTNRVWKTPGGRRDFFQMGHAVQAALAHRTGTTWVINYKKDGGFDFDFGVAGLVDCKGRWANGKHAIRVPTDTLDRFDALCEKRGQPGFYYLGAWEGFGAPAELVGYATSAMVRAAPMREDYEDPTTHECEDLLELPESGIIGPWENQF